jgi:hypothetical protein
MLGPALYADVQMRSHRSGFIAREAAEKESPEQHPCVCVVVSSPPHATLSLPANNHDAHSFPDKDPLRKPLSHNLSIILSRSPPRPCSAACA